MRKNLSNIGNICLLLPLLVMGCATAGNIDIAAEIDSKDYCTISHFYYLGETGFPAKSERCLVEQKEKLVRAYDEGQVLFEKKQRVQYLTDVISKEDKDKSVVGDVGRVASIFGANDSRKAKEAELHQLNNEISEMIRKAPDSEEYCRNELKQKEQAKEFVPSFMLNMSPGIKAQLDGCSRIVR